MAREIRGVSAADTLYARIIGPTGLWWNGSGFEVYSSGNYSTYAISMAEQGSSGVFVADFPVGITVAGTFDYFVHVQEGGSPAEGDQVANTGRVDWTGSAAVVPAASGTMLGSEFYDYVLRKGFRRTDKSAEVYEAITDAIQEMRRRFQFDEAKTEAMTADTITVLGDYKINVESDLGLVSGVILEDGDTGTSLRQVSKSQFDLMYPYINADPNFTGYPKTFCIFGGQMLIGPKPDRVSYVYRVTYSRRAGTITSGTSVPFTDLYREVLCDLVLSHVYALMDEADKAQYYRQKFENGFVYSMRRENKNSGVNTFIQTYRDC